MPRIGISGHYEGVFLDSRYIWTVVVNGEAVATFATLTEALADSRAREADPMTPCGVKFAHGFINRWCARPAGHSGPHQSGS